MIKKIHMLTYFIVVFSLLSIGYTGSYFSDTEMSNGSFTAADDWPSTLSCTRTLGYWKTQDEAWPVDEITIGGITYAKQKAIDIMRISSDGDKTYDMFKQLIAAKLNILIGCNSSCIKQTINDADAWMYDHPVGSGVPDNSQAWQEGGGGLLHFTLDQYNNGLLCAPRCDNLPYEPTNPMPYNDATGVGIKPTLSVYVSDPGNDTMDIWFYGAVGNNLIDTITNVESGITVSVVWLGLDYGETYEWYVVAEDYEGSTRSDTWRFTTNHPPDAPTLISPTNNSEGVGLSPILKVQVSDQDEDAMNVSFYDASNNQRIGVNVNVADGEVASITWNGLGYSRTYTWYVIVNDSMAETHSDTWSFATIPSPPKGGGSPPSNNPPMANAGGPYSGYVNKTITFDGSGSTDDGTITSYLWDFGDGSNATEINATTTHPYPDVGIYNVTLIVTDNNGATGTNTTTVIIIFALEITNITVTPSPQNIGGHVNITCILANTSKIVDVVLNIIYPNNTTSNISMVNNNETDCYFYNSTYPNYGEHTFFIFANDTSNNTVTSNMYYFSIVDLHPPEIVDNTPESAYKNETFTFNATVTDNVIVADVYVEYWYEAGNHTNTSMNATVDDCWKKNITIPFNHDLLQYCLHAKDISDNWSHTEIKSITLLERR